MRLILGMEARCSLLAVFVLQALLAQPLVVFAQANTSESDGGQDVSSSPSSVRRGGESEYDFSWLDPDKKVFVLQNRKYRKAMKPAFFLGGGLNLNSAFKSAYFVSGRGSFYFTELFGIEAFYNHVGNSNNDTFQALERSSSRRPYVREIKNYWGVLGSVAPFYGKFNIFNVIVYYDWFFNLGLGRVATANDTQLVSLAGSSYVNESHLGLYFGSGQNYFLNRHFSIRWDYIGMTYTGSGLLGENARFFNHDFSLSVGYLL